MELAIVSHAAVAPEGDGWVTKNRVAEIAERLVDLGWDVTLLATPGPRDSFLSHRLSPRIRLEPLAGGIRGRWAAIRRVRRADAVLVFMPTVRTALLALAAGSRCVVYWGNAWGLIDGTPRPRIALESVVARRAGRVIVHGDAIARRFADVRRDVEQCVPLVVREVGERLLSDARPEEEKPAGPLRAVFVGSILERKGLPELLEALRAVPQVECRIVGPRSDRDLARRIDELAAEHPGLTAGEYADWPELRELYRWAHVLALPSRLEGFPRVAYEATAFGAALVLTPVGGIPERLRDGHDALLVPVRDAAGLAGALRHLDGDRVLVQTLVANARRTMRRVFVEVDAAAQFDRRLRGLVRARNPGAASGPAVADPEVSA